MATGDTLAVFTPKSNVPPTSNGATLDQRNNHLVLDFDDTTDESAVFESFLPEHYDGGGLTVTLVWMATSATTGNFSSAFGNRKRRINSITFRVWSSTV